jgi:hypothetical protein
MLTEVDDEELARQLTESRNECERRLGVPCESLAYPYGDLDARVAEAAMAAGYSAAAALAPSERPSSYRWPRVGVYQVDDELTFRLKIARPMRRLQRSHAWSVIGAAARPFRPRDPAVS